MISLLADALGGDQRAIRLARKIGQVIMWLRPLEIRRVFHQVEELIDALIQELRRAA